MKKNKIVLLMVVFILIVTCFSACTKNKFKIHGIAEGFEHSGVGEPDVSFDRIAYKTETNKYSIDEVTIDVSYGYIPRFYYDGRNVSDVSLSFTPIECKVPEDLTYYYAEKEVLIKEIWHTENKIKYKDVQNYTSGDYVVIDTYNENEMEWIYEFSHTERITIPQEMFSFDFGEVDIMLSGHDYALDGHTIDGMFHQIITIYYSKIDNEIYLYDFYESRKAFADLMDWPEFPKFDDSVK